MRSVITTRSDEYQVFTSLKTNRQKRTKRGVVFVEGVAVIRRLIASSVRIDAVIHGPQARLSDWARSVIDAHPDADRYELSDELMRELSDRDEPSEIVVIARRPEFSLDALVDQRPDLLVVMDRPMNPGNLGSAIRSCDAFGADAVIVTGHAADLWDPQCIRASLGAVFSTRCLLEQSSGRLLESIDRLRGLRPELRVIGTDSGGTLAVDDSSVRTPIVLVFGNEATGLSTTLREAVDDIAFIPMHGAVDSLNLAAAVSVTLYAVTRPERPAPANPDVPA